MKYAIQITPAQIGAQLFSSVRLGDESGLLPVNCWPFEIPTPSFTWFDGVLSAEPPIEMVAFLKYHILDEVDDLEVLNQAPNVFLLTWTHEEDK